MFRSIVTLSLLFVHVAFAGLDSIPAANSSSVGLPDLVLGGGERETWFLSDDPELDWRVEVATNVGSFQINLRNDAAPKTVRNFLSYLADGDYNGSFIHRSVPGFVIQGGGYTVTGQGEDFQVDSIPSKGTIPGEPQLPNLRGTVAMALVDGNPDSGTSQWFVNIGNNPHLDDPVNGPFTVFGEINEENMQVVDAINGLVRVNFGGAFSEVPLLQYTEGNPVLIGDLVNVPEITIVDPPQVLENTRPDLVTVSLSGDQLEIEALLGKSGESEVTLGFSRNGVWAEESFTVTVLLAETVPGFGLLEVLPQDNRFRSVIYGELEFASGGSDRTRAHSFSLRAPLEAQGGVVYSPLYGQLTPNEWEIDDWVVSEFFGLVHFARDASQYGGWVSSERFGWMKFEESGDHSYLWIHQLQTWVEVRPDGTFYSFDFGLLTPISGYNRYHSSKLGPIWTGDYNGWVSSDRFGWVWAARDSGGVWFWSEARQEWLGVMPNGAIWSTAEKRFLDG